MLFLNPDTRLFQESLRIPLSLMEEKYFKDVGICGVQMIDDTGQVARTCSRFPTVWRWISVCLGLNKIPGLQWTGIDMTEWDHEEDREVDHVIGAFYMVRREVFDAIGGFDERFFLYFEDVDFSLRAFNAGWRSYFIKNAKIYHKRGGTSCHVKAKSLFYALNSKILYGFKNFGFIDACLLFVVTLLLEPVCRSAFALLNRDWEGFVNTAKGYEMLYRHLVKALWSGGSFMIQPGK